MTSTTENPPAPDADPRGGEREKLAAEFEVLAEKATQGEVEADPDDRSGMEWNWHVVQGDDRLCFMSNGPRSEANAAFIAWCFNHRADIRAALRPQPNAAAPSPAMLSVVPKPIAWRIKWPKGTPGALDGFGLTDSWELAEARQRQGATLTPLYEQVALASATPTARAQAAAGEVFDFVRPGTFPRAYWTSRIAAIIAKHLGAGAGLTPTGEEREFVKSLQFDVDIYHTHLDQRVANKAEDRVARFTNVVKLLDIIARLTPGEANHG